MTDLAASPSRMSVIRHPRYPKTARHWWADVGEQVGCINPAHSLSCPSYLHRHIPSVPYGPEHPLTVPLELIRPIIACCGNDPPTLHALSLCCHYFRSEAEAWLYRSCMSGSARAHERFLTTILNNGRLAGHVKEYAARTIHLGGDDASLWKLVRIAVQKMVNLERLVVDVEEDHSYKIYMNPQAFSFNLCSLTWVYDADDADFALFLAMQTRLTRLEWICKDRDIKVSPTACPGLRVFAGNWPAIKAILPGRNIAVLTWNAQEPRLQDEFDCRPLSKEFNSLRSLVLGEHFSPPAFAFLGKNLQSLRFLQLNENYSSGLECLPKFCPQLKTLAFGIRPDLPDVPAFPFLYNNDQDDSWNADDAGSRIADLFAQYSALRHLIIAFGSINRIFLYERHPIGGEHEMTITSMDYLRRARFRV